MWVSLESALMRLEGQDRTWIGNRDSHGHVREKEKPRERWDIIKQLLEMQLKVENDLLRKKKNQNPSIELLAKQYIVLWSS